MSAATKGVDDEYGPPVDDGVEAISLKPPRGGLKEWDVSQLEFGVNDALERSRNWKQQGNEPAAIAWGNRYLELVEELDRRAATQKTGAKRATKTGRTKKESRLAALGPYAPVPRAINKPGLSLAAKGLAFTIANQINLGPWNTDLHVDISYPELVEKTGVSRWTLMRLIGELAGDIEAENLGRGGVRLRFISSSGATDQ